MPSPGQRHAVRDQGPAAPAGGGSGGRHSLRSAHRRAPGPGPEAPDWEASAGAPAAGATPPSRGLPQPHRHSRHRLRPDPRAPGDPSAAAVAGRDSGGAAPAPSPGAGAGGGSGGRAAMWRTPPARHNVRYGASSLEEVEPFNYGSPARGIGGGAGGGAAPGGDLLPSVMVADSTQFGGKLSLQRYARGSARGGRGGGGGGVAEGREPEQSVSQRAHGALRRRDRPAPLAPAPRPAGQVDTSENEPGGKAEDTPRCEHGFGRG
jgi:hypothetical protein